MILPSKNISLANSILGGGSLILSELSSEQTISSLWEKSKKYPEINSFEKFVTVLDVLYILGSLEFQDGIISRLNKND